MAKTKRNPPDATGRNVRASLKRDADLVRRIRAAETRLARVERLLRLQAVNVMTNVHVGRGGR